MQEIKKLNNLMPDNFILPKVARNQSRSLRISKTSFDKALFHVRSKISELLLQESFQNL
jgi:hypothetical protein